MSPCPKPSPGRRTTAAGAVGFVLAVVFALGDRGPLGPPAAHAATRRPATLTEEAARLDQAAGRLAEPEALRRLAQAFHVSPQQVADLREQKLAFGDTGAALAVARVARKPLNTVVALWANERLDWSDVAARLGAPRSRVLRQLLRARQALEAAPAR